MRIGKSLRTRVLEEIRIHGRFTSLRVVKTVPTTELICVKSFTSTLTGHNRTMNSRNTVLQNIRTRGNEICFTTNHGALTFTLVRCNCQWGVETVDEADAVRGEVVVAVVYVELYQCGG